MTIPSPRVRIGLEALRRRARWIGIVRRDKEWLERINMWCGNTTIGAALAYLKEFPDEEWPSP